MRNLPEVSRGSASTVKGRSGQNLVHESAHKHVSGEAVYIDDMATPANTLHAYVGLSQVARLMQEYREVVVRLRVIRPDFQGASIHLPRLVRCSHLFKQKAIIVEGRGIIRIQMNGFPIMGFSKLSAPTPLVQYCEIVMRLGIGRTQV